MSSFSPKVPFVNLSLQHQPIQSQITETLGKIIERGDFILGQALAEFETAFAAASGVKYGVGVACGTDAIALGLQACDINPRLLSPPIRLSPPSSPSFKPKQYLSW
jgi:dTDP-4-amino-4,6-dideoxygalactose transaminase